MSRIVGFIPAAGEGKRLYPFSRAVPKEMYPILGKAVIEHSIENLKVAGIRKIFMLVGFQKGALMDYIGNGSFFGVDIAYLYQHTRKGLGHAILQGRDWIDDTFAVLLGDSFIEPKEEMREMINYHLKEKPLATVMLSRVKSPEGYGIARFGSKGTVTELVEKPDKKTAAGMKTNGWYHALCGAYVLEPGIFRYIERTKPGVKGEIQITDALELAIKSGEKVNGYALKGRYLDIGKWGTVLNIEKEIFRGADIAKHVEERDRMMEKITRDE